MYGNLGEEELSAVDKGNGLVIGCAVVMESDDTDGTHVIIMNEHKRQEGARRREFMAMLVTILVEAVAY